MSTKSKKPENNLNGIRSGKKQINDITDWTRRIILEKFSDEQLTEFRELFDMFDKDNQEMLTLQTLVSVMKTVGHSPTESDMIDLMRDIDIDHSGTIDFYEFVNVISRNMYPSETNQEIRHAFDLFDQNQDGLLTFDDLKLTIEKYLNSSMNDFEIHQMIELADRNGHGHVSFEDFLHAAVCRNDKKRNNISRFDSCLIVISFHCQYNSTLMFINLFAFFLLLVELLSLGGLSSINGNDNQQQAQIANTLVNQWPFSTILSTASINMYWLKTLKNITEFRGQTILLECQVTSLYPVSFNWYRYNNPMNKNSFTINKNLFQSSIRLNNLKESQTGFYTCEVSNGFQTLTSTGYVRMKNSDIDPIDSNDDSLLFSEFQPEIITNNEEVIIDQLTCELYTGNTCRSMLGSNYVSLNKFDQKEIEQKLIDNIQLISNECRRLLLPLICFFVYPVCDKINQITKRSMCRKSCFNFQNNICMKNIMNEQKILSNIPFSYHIPTCDSLPPSSDDSSCIMIDQPRNVSSISKISPIVENSSASSYFSLSFSFKIFISSILLCLLLLLSYCYYYNRNQHKNRLSPFSSKLSPRKQSSPLVNPIQSSPYHTPINIRQNNQLVNSSSSASAHTNLSCLNHRQTLHKSESNYQQIYFSSVNNVQHEIPFTNIRFLEEIGEGEFGRIFIGEVIDSENKCIIKTLQNENVEKEYFREIEIFRHIHHINISRLIGVCTEQKNPFLLMMYEYFSNGDLHEYLISQRSKHTRLTDFLFVSKQIVSGMIYLSDRNFLHNDLSTKNILICEHLNVKITNIGRYRQQYQLDYYNIANHLLPIRWMSIESIFSGIYSEMSDVWSFGVLLWEMFSYGIQPYYGYTNPEVIEMIRDRVLLTCPMNCPKRIYELMCSCWEEIDEQRPAFIELMQRLKELQEKPTVSPSIDDEIISLNRFESLKEKYRTLI
ncbi:unnamed protein product [Rotaria magnacalcarata]|uniref:Receptor protein-tyrosine kinase n=1 Tax=Rotaria magnacalcarata TaxID=392030 RepID=A0A814FXB6_9BILA|nr:unnamed protein product [Rotaria magnacalcarata]